MLRNRIDIASRPRAKPRLAGASPRRFRPRIDALEGRALLATLVVTSPADSGPGTLRDRVAIATSGDTITFAHALNGRTITLTSGPIIDAGKSLAIQGPGDSKLAISGGGTQGILVFNQGASPIDVSVSGLTLEDGNSAGPGAAIATLGANLTLTGDTFRDNTGGGFGGAVDVETADPFGPPANTVTIVDSQFLNNTAGAGGAYQSYGANVTVRGSTFAGNTSTGSFGGGLLVGNGSLSVSDSTFRGNVGGGVEFFGVSPSESLTVTRSLFDGNTRPSGPGGGLDATASGAVTITASTFRDNATNDPNFALGGGAAIFGGLDSVTVDGSTFLDNRADNPDAQLGQGGGLFIQDARVVSVTNSTFRGNLARGRTATGGGASQSTYTPFFTGLPSTTYSGDTFVDNTASSIDSVARGGGLGVESAVGPVTVTGSSFVHNQALGRDQTTAFGLGTAWGGGLYASLGYNFSGPQGALTVSGSNFVGNTAKAGSSQYGSFSEGGAVYAFTYGPVVFSGGTYVNNSALGGDATGAGASGGLGFGGAIRVVLSGSAPTVTGGTFVGNTAVGGRGGAGGYGGPADGGAISAQVGALSDATFTNNSAIAGRGGDATSDGPGGPGGSAFGGAVAALVGTVTNVTFNGNVAQGGDGGNGFGSGAGGTGGFSGGGAATSGGATVSSSQFVHNASIGGRGGNGGATGAGGDGGFAAGGGLNDFSDPSLPLTVLDSLFVQNQAIGGAGGSGTTAGASSPGLGGGIAIFGAPAVIKRTKFVKNRASTDGNDVFGPYTS